MPTFYDPEVRPPERSRWTNWPDIGRYAMKRYARRRGRSAEDPDVQDYGQEVVTRVFRRYTENPGRYEIGDEFHKLVLGVMKFVSRETWRALVRWRQVVTKLSQQWEDFISAPDPRLLDWQEDYDLILVPVESRSDVTTMTAFRLLQFEGMPAKEVAEELDITVQAVYSAKFNIIERFIEEEGFLKLERLLRSLWQEPAIRRALAGAKAQCPKSMHAVIDQLYGSQAPGNPKQVESTPKALYQARAALLKRLEPILIDICRREEGVAFDD